MTLNRSASGLVTRTRLCLVAVLAIAAASCDDGAPDESAAPAEPTVETQESGLAAGSCRADADCRTFSDYCTGCDCRALPTRAKDPVCSGPGVQCLVDPCRGQRAVCEAGRCALRPEGACRPAPDPNPCATVLCPPDTRCVAEPVVCVRAPCPPIARCVPVGGVSPAM